LTFTLIIRPRAEEDVLSSRDWYRRQREGLDLEFQQALDEVMASVAEDPQRFLVVFRGGLRRALLHRFPYAVFFRITGEKVFLLGVLRQQRSRSLIRRRLQREPTGA
jgi:plasmid stabilization system protein ParE